MQPATRYRTINKDGSLNVVTRRGISIKDLYHDLLKSSWTVFALVFVGVFFLLNGIFGFFYSFLPLSQFEGFRYEGGWMHWLESFFFSVQTFGTVGYGKISPIGMIANAVVTFECCTSLFVVALMTGLIFARFAKPNGKVLASYYAVIRNYDGIPSLMFRLANERQNYVTDARVNVSLAMDDLATGYRTFTDLVLERNSSPIFSLSWTIAHDIDSMSPLYGLSQEEMCKRNAELVVTFRGSDTTLSQNVYAKFSYISEEIKVDHDFVDVIRRGKDGKIELMLENFHKTRLLEAHER